MKRIISIVVFCLVSTVASANIINGSFETGDLTGWNTSLNFYTREGIYLGNPLPSDVYFTPPSVVNDMGYNNVPNALVDGNYAGEIYNHNFPYSWLYGLPHYYEETITLSQTVQMNAGDRLSGFMTFGSVDMIGYPDCSFIAIDNVPIYSLDIRDAYYLDPRNPDPNHSTLASTPWVSWSWTAPTSGNYTLSLNVLGDDQLDGWAYFDDIKITSVPEPSTVVMLGFGTVMLFVSRRIVHTHREA